MSKPKLYFASERDEYCYPLAYHMADTKKDGLEEIELVEADRDSIDSVFYCGEYMGIGEDGDCGFKCDGYSPKNGKSGMCRHRSNVLYEHGKIVKFKVK